MRSPLQDFRGHKFAFDSPEQELFLNLWRTYDCLKVVEEQVLSRHELSAQQYNLLRILQIVYPNSVPTLKLGRSLISRAPDITRMLDRLEKRQWLERERLTENRRVVEVRLTAAGQEFLTGMAAEICDMHHRQLGHLSPVEQRQLLKLLKLARRGHDDGSSGYLSQ